MKKDPMLGIKVFKSVKEKTFYLYLSKLSVQIIML